MFDSQCWQSLLPRFNDRHQAKRKIKDKRRRPYLFLSIYMMAYIEMYREEEEVV